jgi:hypothetical protein
VSSDRGDERCVSSRATGLLLPCASTFDDPPFGLPLPPVGDATGAVAVVFNREVLFVDECRELALFAKAESIR